MSVEQLSQGQGAPTVPAAEAPDEFDLAMDEFVSGDAPPADVAAGKDVNDPNDAPDPADTPPGSTPEAGQPPQAAGAPPPASEQSTDIWANAPADLREAHQAALRAADDRFNSVRGRLSTADRQLAQLRAQQGRPDPAPVQEGTGQQPQGQPENPFKSEAITKLREDYGEVAGPLVDMMEQLYGEVSRLKQPVQQLGQERHEAHLTQQESLLATRHADWQTTVQDPRFGGWVQSQPRFVQEALSRNADNIVDAEEAASVLDMFKVAIGAGATPPPPPPPTPTPDPQVQSLDSRRQRQLDAGKDAGRSGAAPSVSGIPDDFDAAMEAYIAKADRQGRN